MPVPVGLAAGVILYHAAFGFTAAWREVALTGRSAGVRAQMIMLGTTVLIFTPLIAQGEIFGIAVRGSVAPVNLGVVCGAFIFGIGMQLGGDVPLARYSLPVAVIYACWSRWQGLLPAQ